MGRESGIRVPRGNDTEYKCAVGAGAGGGGALGLLMWKYLHCRAELS